MRKTKNFKIHWLSQVLRWTLGNTLQRLLWPEREKVGEQKRCWQEAKCWGGRCGRDLPLPAKE